MANKLTLQRVKRNETHSTDETGKAHKNSHHLTAKAKPQKMNSEEQESGPFDQKSNRSVLPRKSALQGPVSSKLFKGASPFKGRRAFCQPVGDPARFSVAL